MTDYSELTDRIHFIEQRGKALSAEIALIRNELAKRTAEPPKRGRRRPANGEDYWLLYNDGFPTSAKWLDAEADKLRWQRGNCYRTEAEARAADERNLVLQRLRDLAEEAGPVGSEWYELLLKRGQWVTTNCVGFAVGAIRFPTHESAEAAIRELGDRLDCLKP